MSHHRAGKWMVFAILLAGMLLCLALRGVDWPVLWTSVREAKLPLVALALLVVNVSFFLRALRWRVLLSARAHLRRVVVFSAMSVGYLGNSLLPARAGDVIRSAVLKQRVGISFGYALATTLAERLMDVAALVLIGLTCMATVRGLAGWVVHTTVVMAIAAALGTTVLLALPRAEPALARFAAHSRLRGFKSSAISIMLREFLLGMRSLQEPVRACQFVGLTAVIWLLDALAVATVARALDLSFSLQTAFLLLAALGLASAVPSTPGYIGIYQFVAVTVLMPLGLTRTHALAHILLYQTVVYCVVLFWGGICSWQAAGVRLNGRWRIFGDEAGPENVDTEMDAADIPVSPSALRRISQP